MIMYTLEALKGRLRRFTDTQTKEECNYFPKDGKELKDIIYPLIEEDPQCDLNDVWVGDIIEMDYLFCGLKFNGDISRWDVSNVETMSGMFRTCTFNGDISNWNVINVEDMQFMFKESSFNGDISDWDVRNVKSMYEMFCKCPFNGDISSWDVSKVGEMEMDDMFKDCPIEKNPPKWYRV